MKNNRVESQYVLSRVWKTMMNSTLLILGATFLLAQQGVPPNIRPQLEKDVLWNGNGGFQVKLLFSDSLLKSSSKNIQVDDSLLNARKLDYGSFMKTSLSFADEYKHDGGNLDSALEGRQVNYEDICLFAAEKFVRQAASLGIEENDISTAMIEGRFNPKPEDVQLAYRGTGRFTSEIACNDFRRAAFRMIYHAKYRDEIRQVFLDSDAGEYRSYAGKKYFEVKECEKTFDIFRNVLWFDDDFREQQSIGIGNIEMDYFGKCWENRFGVLNEITPKRTRVLGKEKTSGETVAFIQRMRFKTVFSLFQLRYFASVQKKDALALDYVWMRENWYLPSLKERAFEPIRKGNESYKKKTVDEAVAKLTIQKLQEKKHSEAINKNIVALQTILHDEGILVSADGTWDNNDNFALSKFVKILQSDEALNWKYQLDGRYTDVFSDALGLFIEALDQSNPTVARLANFKTSADFLRGNGLSLEYIALPKPVLESATAANEHQKHSSSISPGDRWRAYCLIWFNGFLWETGDETLVWARKYAAAELNHKSQNGLQSKAEAKKLINQVFESDHPAIPFFIVMIGTYFSPLGAIAIGFTGCREQRDGAKGFKLGAIAELFEGSVSAIGEYSTMGSIDFPILVICTGIACVFTGGTCYWVSQQPRMSPSRMIKYELPLPAIGVAIVALTFLV